MLPDTSRRGLLKGALGVAGAAALSSRYRPAGAQSVKLTNVEHDSRPLDNAAYAAVYDAFKAQNPDIEIEFQIIPWEQARAKMLTLGQAGDLPDMGRMAWASDFAAADMLVPLESMVDPATLTQFDQIILDSAMALGSDGQKHFYGLPWFAGSPAILVNKTLLDKAGLPLKESWTTDEFTEYAKALTTEGQQWGVALDVAGIGDPVQNLMLAAYAYGGKWVAGDPTGTEPEPLLFNSPETIAGITWYADLFRKGYAVPSAPTDTYKERDANFQSGKGAMAWQGPWSLVETQDIFTQNNFELASMPLPSGPGGNPGWYGGALASIYVKAQEDNVVEQAFKWISFLSSDEGEKLYCKTNGMIPASSTAVADPYWSENDLYKGYIGSMQNAKIIQPLWATGLDGILDDTVPPLFQGVLTDQLSVEDMVSQIQDAVVEGLKMNGVEVPES